MADKEKLKDNDLICDNCFTAECWQGEMYCDKYKTSGTMTVRVFRVKKKLEEFINKVWSRGHIPDYADDVKIAIKQFIFDNYHPNGECILKAEVEKPINLDDWNMLDIIKKVNYLLNRLTK